MENFWNFFTVLEFHKLEYHKKFSKIFKVYFFKKLKFLELEFHGKLKFHKLKFRKVVDSYIFLEQW